MSYQILLKSSSLKKWKGFFSMELEVSSPMCMNVIVTSCVIKDKLVNVSVPGLCRYNME